MEKTSEHKLTPDDVSCSICMFEFNYEKQMPKKVCTNKHIVCEKCLWLMYVQAEVDFACPYCKQPIEKLENCVIHENVLKKSAIKGVKEKRESDKEIEKNIKIPEKKVQSSPIAAEFKAKQLEIKPEKKQIAKPQTAEKFETPVKNISYSAESEKKPIQSVSQAPVKVISKEPIVQLIPLAKPIDRINKEQPSKTVYNPYNISPEIKTGHKQQPQPIPELKIESIKPNQNQEVKKEGSTATKVNFQFNYPVEPSPKKEYKI